MLLLSLFPYAFVIVFFLTTFFFFIENPHIDGLVCIVCCIIISHDWQNSSKPESSQGRVPKEISNDNVDLWKQRGVRWEPLDMVFEVANKILSPKPTIQEHVMSIHADMRENDSRAPRCHVKNSSNQTKAASVHNVSTRLASNSTEIRRSQRNLKRAK